MFVHVMRLRPRKRRNEADPHRLPSLAAWLFNGPRVAIYDRLPTVWVQTTQGEKMPRHKGPRRAFLAAFAMALFAAVIVSAAGAARGNDQLSKINHIVVIYEENHSCDNLYGGWEGVNGLANAKAKQVNQSGAPFNCLMQQDVNLTVPPLTSTCTDSTSVVTPISSHFANQSCASDSLSPPTAPTCPKPGVFAANGVVNGQGVAG